jgi:hypothetical protein
VTDHLVTIAELDRTGTLLARLVVRYRQKARDIEANLPPLYDRWNRELALARIDTLEQIAGDLDFERARIDKHRGNLSKAAGPTGPSPRASDGWFHALVGEDAEDSTEALASALGEGVDEAASRMLAREAGVSATEQMVSDGLADIRNAEPLADERAWQEWREGER